MIFEGVLGKLVITVMKTVKLTEISEKKSEWDPFSNLMHLMFRQKTIQIWPLQYHNSSPD